LRQNLKFTYNIFFANLNFLFYIICLGVFATLLLGNTVIEEEEPSHNIRKEPAYKVPTSSLTATLK